jgi:hypothetical protein
MKCITTVAIILLTGCSNSSSPATPVYAPQPSSRPAQISMAASAWRFQFSQNVSGPVTAGTGWSFTFPVEKDGVHYLVTVPPILTGKSALTMSGNISALSGTTFVPETQAGMVDTSGAANCGAYFQEVGDNLSGAVQNGVDYAYYRWFSNPTRLRLTNGSFSLTIPLSGANWVSVFGVFGNVLSARTGTTMTAAQGFANALANPAWTGITCGGMFAGHGVYTIGGTATFTMSTFSVE